MSQEFEEAMVVALQGIHFQVRKRNELLSKHSSNYVQVEERRTLAIEKLSKAIESIINAGEKT